MMLNGVIESENKHKCLFISQQTELGLFNRVSAAFVIRKNLGIVSIV